MNLEQLRARLKELGADLEAFIAKGISTDEDFTKLNEIGAEIESVEKKIKALEDAVRHKARVTGTTAITAGTVAAEAKNHDEGKFKSFGEQLQAIAAAGLNKGAQVDQRLVWQKAAGANEAVPSEGGFLVQTDYSTELLGLMHEMGEIVRRVRDIPISSNSNGIKLPVIDETSRAGGSRFGGIASHWAQEGGTVAESRPKFASIELKLNKVMGVGYATEELLNDAAALESVYRTAFSEEMTFTVEDAYMNGDGAGKPLGYLNSPALITVDPESGQAADTIVAMNVLNMMARLPTRSMRNAVWLTTQDALPQLWSMTMPGSNYHMFAPPGINGNVEANAPAGTLLGRPVIPVEYSAKLGDAGDLQLVDLSQYLTITRNGEGLVPSMHVRFLYDEMTFRITMRVDGQPAVRTPITPANGGPTQSPFIVLGAR